MTTPQLETARRPSTWWIVVSLSCGLLTAGALLGAISFQRSASAPIGEGEVFIADAEMVSRLLADSSDSNTAVRHARNLLDVEAISIVGSDGVVVATTSSTLLDEAITNPLLGFGAQSGRMTALASPIASALLIDGVPEWPAESVLYQVLSPQEDGTSVLIHYDLSGLLARRVQPGVVQPETIQFLALGGVFALLGAAVFMGHMRASRRYRNMELESEFLRVHSKELEATNRDLDQALDLAEEKMRIRSEFVLMINHELRTPLTSVVTGAEMIESGSTTPREAAQILRAMVADGQRLQEIIDQILAVARIENRGLSYELRSVPLPDVCGAMHSAHPAANSGHTGKVHDNLLVKTDVSTLSIVVASLVDNALTHGASSVEVSCGSVSSIEPMATIGTRPGVAAFITIADDGPGIDQEFLPRMFEKFEKASFSSGTGLGLYMARLMVEALEGSIGVQTSRLGTVFEIALPAVASKQLVVVK